MSKEYVQLDLTGVTKELPYRDYYKGRNGLVAKYIANYMGLPYLGEVADKFGANGYFVPPVTQVRGVGVSLNIKSSEDFYGLIVDDANHVGKSILHLSISGKVPKYYSYEFAESVKDLVLPGLTVFSKEDAVKGFSLLSQVGDFDIRTKLSDKSDGHGQFLIKNEQVLQKIFDDLGQDYIKSNGVVLEANVNEAKTISVGFAVLGRDIYSFLAIQKNDKAPEDGRDRYMGALVRVVRGEVDKLIDVANDPIEINAIRAGENFYNRYKSFNPIASRLSFDYLYGVDNYGNAVSGITDITGRLGGTCPALVLAATEFKRNSNLSVVESEVSLNYNPSVYLDSEKNAVRFIDLPTLRLSSRVNKTI